MTNTSTYFVPTDLLSESSDGKYGDKMVKCFFVLRLESEQEGC